MQNRHRVWLANQFGVEIEKEVETAIRFRVVDGTRHENVSRVVIPLRLDETGVDDRNRNE